VLDTPMTVHKQVCARRDSKTGGHRMVSVFDGETRYRLGHTTRSARGAAGWPPLDAALYCYRTTEEAKAARFPASSVATLAPVFMVHGKAWGRAFVHRATGRWAVEFFKVLGFDVWSGAPAVLAGA